MGYKTKASTSYIRALGITAGIIAIPICCLMFWFSYNVFLYQNLFYALYFFSIPTCYIAFTYYGFRFQFGSVIINSECIELKSALAKKVVIPLSECKTFGAVGKLQSLVLQPVAWLYFSDKAITEEKAWNKSPNSNRHIIYVSLESKDALEKIKDYLPKDMYDKIICDLIARHYPI